MKLLDPHGPESQHVQNLTLASFEDLYRLADMFDGRTPKPLYRGQSDYSWKLETLLERNVPTHVIKEVGLETFEYRILTEAQRRLHQFLGPLPDEDDRLSWLALLRHNGTPTRLLDVTHSLFIACHFALRDAQQGKDAAVWIFSRHEIDFAFTDWNAAIDNTFLRTTPFTATSSGDPYYWSFPRKLESRAPPMSIDTLRFPGTGGPWLDRNATLDAAMRGYIEKPGVAVSEPFWISRRMDVQQGAFLIPFNVKKSFEENLFSFLGLSLEEHEERLIPTNEDDLSNLWHFFKVIKLRVPAELNQMLKAKLGTMNIRDLTLFPDADGALAQISAFSPMGGR